MTTEFCLPPDERRPHSFRLYRLRGENLCCLGDTDTAEGVGYWIVQLYEEGEFEVGDSVGVLRCREADEPGEWIVCPFGSRRR